MSSARRVTQAVPASNEFELVAAVRRGDDRAFEELYARYRSRIGAYIFGMVGDHGRAEDIAQEVFISALRRLRETERTIIFKPWIYEIAKNACIDEFRRTRRIHEVPLESDEDREFPVASLPSTSPTPDAAVASKQRLTDLRGAFRGLSESHHRILVLRELEGLSYNQIGDRLGMSKPVVESTLFRARRRLGEEFEEIESGRRCARVQALIASDHERPLRSLGIRERRQFARHVGHCELCRRQARDAGIEESLYRAPNLLGRLAVLAPLPWLRSALPYFDASRPASGAGRAIAAAAIVVAGAGAGGGLVSNMTGHAARPPGAVLAAPLPAVGGGTATPASEIGAAPGAAQRTDRYGLMPAAVVGAVGSIHADLLSADGIPRVGGLRITSIALPPSRAHGRGVRLPSGGGTGAPVPPTVTSPTRAAGTADSGGPAANPPAEGAPQTGAPANPAAPAGPGGPGSSGSGLNLGQAGSATIGAVNQGPGTLPVMPGSVSGVMPGSVSGVMPGLVSGVIATVSTQVPPLPSVPSSGSGSGGPGASGAGPTSTPIQSAPFPAAESGASASSPPTGQASGQPGAPVPAPAPSPAS